ncbi:MAG: aromatic ring-hydroxylating dioxygenase subunit alpha [Myxococcales bacterium]|nr:aromatic ring-hydroxylating dioxygenase subunit alpha [Myxococcales bacterium]MCB9755138.1 aromatic ring-hydroxylating dioxygenase subunit alpha [Myxococcales bacterium]
MDTARTPITPYPRGWFLVSRSEELKPRRTKTVHYFGQDIVLYRTADGQAHAVDPYCPHLGAHLGHGGKVDGTSIRCPFHGWTFDGVSGQCKYVPEATRTPKVSLRHWPVQEVSGMILVWYHEQREPPSWRVPEMPDEEGRWTPWMESRWRLNACCQDIVENDIDVAHIPAMHGFSKRIPKVELSTDGPTLRIDSTLTLELEQFGLWGAIEGPLITRKFGLTIGYITFKSKVLGVPIGLRTLGNTTPIDEHHVDVRLMYSVLRSPIRLLDPLIARQYRRFFDGTVNQDVKIWENKMYRLHPALSDADGPFVAYRRWATQFYSEDEMQRARARAREML